MDIAPELIDEMVAHAREEAPLECCGLLATDGEQVVRVFRARNAAASRMRFEVDSADHLRAHLAAEEEGLELGGIYHSHPKTEPAPSQTDVNKAAAWPGALWVIVGLVPETVRERLRARMRRPIKSLRLPPGSTDRAQSNTWTAIPIVSSAS